MFYIFQKAWTDVTYLRNRSKLENYPMHQAKRQIGPKNPAISHI